MLNRFEEAMEKIDGMEKTFETSLLNIFRVFHHHRRLHLSHLYNNNNNIAFQIMWDKDSVFPLSLVKLLVLLYLLLMLL